MSKFESYANKYKTIRMERRNGILQMTLHTDGGSLRWGFLPHGELPEAFYDVGSDYDNRVVIITGTGNEFSGPRANPGTSSFPTRPSIERIDRIHWEGRHLLTKLLDIEVPIISAVNGPAWRHSEIPLLCDIVLAADTAQFQDSAHFPSDVVPGDGMHIVYPLLLGMNRGRYFLPDGADARCPKGAGARTSGRGLATGQAADARMGAGGGSGPATNPAVALHPPPPHPGAQAAHARPSWLWAWDGDAGTG
jgi:enoyl-CoA hydratase/carnithine racemase